MRYSLLNYIVCPETGAELVCVVTREKPAPIGHVMLSGCSRVNGPGTLVGPLPASASHTPVTAVLSPHASPAAEPARNYQVRIQEGLLIATDTGRWYPIREFIPEMLPDHLRNFDRDFEFLASLQPHLPPAVFNALNNRAVFSNASKANQDAGLSHKQAEMSMEEKVADQPGFFGPGYISPFNPHAPDHTIFLIRMFGFCMALFFNGQRRVILDSGCGYSWTTEWMLRMGFEPIGIEISRVYLDIANTRVGDLLPYVLVGDAEKLPIRDSVLDGVLGFDAFHHISNRKGAMQEFYRTMKPGALIVLAEPGSAHKHLPSVKEIMKKLGTLEIGMELPDVQEYVRGSGLKPPVQHHILRVPHSDVKGKVSPKFLQQYSFNPANLFTIEK